MTTDTIIGKLPPLKARFYIYLACSAVFALVPILLSFWLLGNEAMYYIRWVVVLLVLAMMAFPMSSVLFRNSYDYGWIYSFFLGVLIPAFFIWTLSYIGIPVFTSVWGIILSAILFLAINIFLRFKKLYPLPGEQILLRKLPLILLETGMFLFAFLIWTYVRSHHPEYIDLEKFMDFGFMMSMIRTDTLPAQDIWLAGQPINYYYFGQYLFTFVSKLAYTHPAFSYNTSIALSFAFTFTMAFALVRDMLHWRSRCKYDKLAQADDIREVHVSTDGFQFKTIHTIVVPHIGGVVAAILLCLAGNSHSFFYKEGNLGNKILHYLTRMGLDPGKLTDYFFADSTRFIGYNPPTNDQTIHEFPYYSFLVADLHAHMINLSVVLLMFAALFALFLYIRRKPENLDKFQILHAAPFLLLGFLLGVSQMTNYWDFVIYIVVAFFTLFVIFSQREKKLGSLADIFSLLVGISLIFAVFLFLSNTLIQAIAFLLLSIAYFYAGQKLTSYWWKIAQSMSYLFTISHFVALLFNFHLDSMPKKLSLTDHQSGLFALFILWFAHVTVALIFVIVYIHDNRKRIRQERAGGKVVEKDGATGIIGAEKKGAAGKAAENKGTVGKASENKGLDKKGATGKTAEKNLFLSFVHGNVCDVFTLILILSALGLLIAPELIYLVDIYEGSFSRANTMFKFTYQPFSMLAIVMAITLSSLVLRLLPKYRLDRIRNHEEKEELVFAMPKRYQGQRTIDNIANFRLKTLIPLTITLMLVIIPLHYTSSIYAWYGTLKREDRLGLDGTIYYGSEVEEDLRTLEEVPLQDRLYLIDFLNDNENKGVINVYNDSLAKAQPVILEAYGTSYSNYCAVSAYTGLPTVIGWQTHEWLWRTTNKVEDAFTEIILPLQNEVRNIYEADSALVAKQGLEKHNVTYLIVGIFERNLFPNMNEEMLKSLGKVIFQSGDEYIIQVQ